MCHHHPFYSLINLILLIRFIYADYQSDVDECKVDSRCNPTAAHCVNTEGSFQCICKGGYAREGRFCVGKRSVVYLWHHSSFVLLNKISCSLYITFNNDY